MRQWWKAEQRVRPNLTARDGDQLLHRSVVGRYTYSIHALCPSVTLPCLCETISKDDVCGALG